MKNINVFFQFLTGQVRGYKKNRSSSRRFKAYYLDTKNDNRGIGAKVIDYLLSRLLVFFVIFTVIYMEFKNIFVALITAIILLTLIHMISIEIRNNRLEKNRMLKRKYIASQKVYKEIMNKTQDELKDYICKLLESMNFTEINFDYLQNKIMFIQGKYKGERINVLFFSYKNDFDVEVKDIKEMIQGLVKHDVKKGIIITTSEFTKDCYLFIEQLTGKYKLMLINKDVLLRLLDKNGMFPKEEEIDELIENKISKKERYLKEYKDIIFSPNKIKGYLILAVYLIVASLYVPFTMYYIIAAIFALMMGVLTVVFTSIKRKNQQDETVNIEHLFKNF